MGTTNASLAALVGLPLRRTWTWLQYILSYHHTAVNHLWVKCVLPSFPSITSIWLTTIGSFSPTQPRLQLTHKSTSQTQVMLKPTPMLNLHFLITVPISLCTAMHAGVLRLVWLFMMALCFLYLNFKVWAEASSFIKVAPLCGLPFNRKRLPSALARQKFGPQTKYPKLVVAVCHLASSVCKGGHNIPDTLESSTIYNDDEACVHWLHNMTTKQIQHMDMHENSVCEWVQDSSLQVLHIKGKINPTDIFTKEMQDGLIFDIYEILSYVDYPISSSSHWWRFISHISKMSSCFIRLCHWLPCLWPVLCRVLIWLPFVLCLCALHLWIFCICWAWVVRLCAVYARSFQQLY